MKGDFLYALTEFRDLTGSERWQRIKKILCQISVLLPWPQHRVVCSIRGNITLHWWAVKTSHIKTYFLWTVQYLQAIMFFVLATVLARLKPVHSIPLGLQHSLETKTACGNAFQF